MSVIRCESCERLIDTDYVDGIWAKGNRAWDYFFCSPECAEGAGFILNDEENYVMKKE